MRVLSRRRARAGLPAGGVGGSADVATLGLGGDGVLRLGARGPDRAEAAFATIENDASPAGGHGWLTELVDRHRIGGESQFRAEYTHGLTADDGGEGNHSLLGAAGAGGGDDCDDRVEADHDEITGVRLGASGTLVGDEFVHHGFDALVSAICQPPAAAIGGDLISDPPGVEALDEGEVGALPGPDEGLIGCDGGLGRGLSFVDQGVPADGGGDGDAAG